MTRKRKWHEENKMQNAKRSSVVVENNRADGSEFEEQLLARLQSVLLGPADAWRYDTAWNDVRAALQGVVHVPFNLHRFGSSVTGLAFNGSDIDLCLEMLRPLPRSPINVVQASLRAQPRLFSHVQAVKGARVPVVKFLHRPSGLSGDVTFSGMLAVYNSALINVLCSMDARVRPVLAWVKHWARTQGLTNSATESHRLSPYALCLMTVFYLQVRGVLPSVARMMAQRRPSVFELGWECGFGAVPRPDRAVCAGLLDLITGFFAFYAAFAFDTQVVCPLLGHTVPHEAFRDAATLPPEMSAYADKIVPKRTEPENLADKVPIVRTIEESAADKISNPLPSVDKSNNASTSADRSSIEATSGNKTSNAPAAVSKNSNAPASGNKQTKWQKKQGEWQRRQAARPASQGLSLGRPCCVQDPFALDHNVTRGQNDKSFAHFRKALKRAADVCSQTPEAGLLPALLVPQPEMVQLTRVSVRREPGDAVSAARWSAVAVDVARAILEALALHITALPSEQEGCHSFACNAPHEVLKGRAEALASLKTLAKDASWSPVALQAQASECLRPARPRPGPPLASFLVHLRPAPCANPGLVVEVLAEEADAKPAKRWAHAVLNGVQNWLPAEMKHPEKSRATPGEILLEGLRPKGEETASKDGGGEGIAAGSREVEETGAQNVKVERIEAQKVKVKRIEVQKVKAEGIEAQKVRAADVAAEKLEKAPCDRPIAAHGNCGPPPTQQVPKTSKRPARTWRRLW